MKKYLIAILSLMVQTVLHAESAFLFRGDTPVGMVEMSHPNPQGGSGCYQHIAVVKTIEFRYPHDSMRPSGVVVEFQKNPDMVTGKHILDLQTVDIPNSDWPYIERLFSPKKTLIFAYEICGNAGYIEPLTVIDTAIK